MIKSVGATGDNAVDGWGLVLLDDCNDDDEVGDGACDVNGVAALVLVSESSIILSKQQDGGGVPDEDDRDEA